MEVLLIEDDPEVARLITRLLNKENWVVTTVDRAASARSALNNDEYAVIIVDLGLPDIHGGELIASLRSTDVNTPILVVTGSRNLGERVGSLGVGADDFVTKPFHGAELIARIKAVVRRASEKGTECLEVGGIILDPADEVAWFGSKPIPMTSKEFAMLEFMAKNRGRAISKQRFMSYLYDYGEEPALKILDVYVSKIRSKLREVGAPDSVIETVRGEGYRVN